jgi:hypothetical protein
MVAVTETIGKTKGRKSEKIMTYDTHEHVWIRLVMAYGAWFWDIGIGEIEHGAGCGFGRIS